MSPFHLRTKPMSLSVHDDVIVRRSQPKTVSVRSGPISSQRRSGSILIFSALLMAPLLLIVALAVDVGYLCVIRTELQRAADAGALAGAAGLYAVPEAVEMKSYHLPPQYSTARRLAQHIVVSNSVSRNQNNRTLRIDQNTNNSPQGDIVIGRLNDPSNTSEPLTVVTDNPNTVWVRVRMTDSHANGPAPLFFARALGRRTANVSASAMATVDHPRLLPFATSEDKWKSLLDGGDGDRYSYRAGTVAGDQDGVAEIKIFPNDHWDGIGLPPGNFGALQIGPRSGTYVLRSQIDMGPTESDMAHHGRVLECPVEMPGETGVKADVQTALAGGNADGREYPGILGDARYLPVYSDVTGNGANASFTISKFVSVRVMDAKLIGQPKWIVVQPVFKIKDLIKVRLTR